MVKVALYTANFGNYEIERPINAEFIKGIDYYYYTEGDDAKLLKINPYKYLPELRDYDVLIWLDGNIEPLAPVHHLINDEPMTVLRHLCTKYDDIYVELESKLRNPRPRTNVENIRKQISRYREEGIPARPNVAIGTGIIVRRDSRDICNAWEAEYKRVATGRDQQSLRYALYQLGEQVNTIPWSTISKKGTSMFYHHNHREHKV